MYAVFFHLLEGYSIFDQLLGNRKVRVFLLESAESLCFLVNCGNYAKMP